MVPQTKPDELAPREQRPPYGTGLDLSEEATEDVNEAVEWPVDADYEEWERYEEDDLPHEAPLLFINTSAAVLLILLPLIFSFSSFR
ncbi:MAG TPA: hypothetical protein VFT06_02805 [Flavisolibacter sp.]|nr:hypothetical protein [Flavisolibacter sp.]